MILLNKPLDGAQSWDWSYDRGGTFFKEGMSS